MTTIITIGLQIGDSIEKKPVRGSNLDIDHVVKGANGREEWVEITENGNLAFEAPAYKVVFVEVDDD